MVKKLKAKQASDGSTNDVKHVDVPLPSGKRVLLPMPAYGMAVRMGMVTAQMNEEERQAFNVVWLQTEYSVLRKALEEQSNVTLESSNA